MININEILKQGINSNSSIKLKIKKKTFDFLKQSNIFEFFLNVGIDAIQ